MLNGKLLDGKSLPITLSFSSLSSLSIINLMEGYAPAPFMGTWKDEDLVEGTPVYSLSLSGAPNMPVILAVFSILRVAGSSGIAYFSSFLLFPLIA